MRKIDPLQEVKAILKEFEFSLEQRKGIWKQLQTDNPNFPQLSEMHWKEVENNSWILGTSEIGEINALETWTPEYPHLSDTAKSYVSRCISGWRKWLEITDAYYEPFEAFEIEDPFDKETLFEFLLRMTLLIEKEGPGARLEWRAFRSFLGYLRNLSSEEVAFIEHISPRKMSIFENKITRLISPEEPSLPVKLVGKTLKELSRICQRGTKTSQLGAAESLRLSWICLATSRLKLPLYFEKVHEIQTSSLLFHKGAPHLLVPNLFGPIKVRISDVIFRFLEALSRVLSKKPRTTILQRSSRSLQRPFETALQNINLPERFGNITYISLLKPPHYAGEHRFQTKKP